MKKDTFPENKIPEIIKGKSHPKAALFVAIFIIVAAIFFSLGRSSIVNNQTPPKKPNPSSSPTIFSPTPSSFIQNSSQKNNCKKDSDCENQTGCANCQILCEKGKCLATKKTQGDQKTCYKNSDCDIGIQCQDGPKGVASCFIRRCEFNRCQTYSFIE